MLQALKHRGPDSTGFALYGIPKEGEWTIDQLLEHAASDGAQRTPLRLQLRFRINRRLYRR